MHETVPEVVPIPKNGQHSRKVVELARGYNSAIGRTSNQSRDCDRLRFTIEDGLLLKENQEKAAKALEREHSGNGNGSSSSSSGSCIMDGKSTSLYIIYKCSILLLCKVSLGSYKLFNARYNLSTYLTSIYLCIYLLFTYLFLFLFLTNYIY